MILAGMALLAVLSWAATALLGSGRTPAVDPGTSESPLDAARAVGPGLALAGSARGGARHAILGGVVAGALLGPTLLGRAAPALHEDLFVGARPQRELAAAVVAERGAWAQAAMAVGADPTAVQQELQDDPAVAAAERRWKLAAEDASSPQRLAALALAMLVALLANPRAETAADRAPRARRALLRLGRSEGPRATPGSAAPPRWADAWSIGLWAAGVPAILVLVALWLNGVQPSSAVALWSVAAMAVGAWGLDRDDRDLAEGVEPRGAALAARAATVATAMAALAAAAAAWRLLEQAPQTEGAAGDAPTTALLLAAALLVGRMARPLPRFSRFAVRWLLPPLAALGMVRLELLHGAAPWLIVAALAISGDGRALGAFLGATLGAGRPARRALRLCLPAAAAAPSQLALGAVGVQALLVPGWVGLALILGALFVEATAILRPRVDRVIQDLEKPPDESAPTAQRRPPRPPPDQEDEDS